MIFDASRNFYGKNRMSLYCISYLSLERPILLWRFMLDVVTSSSKVSSNSESSGSLRVSSDISSTESENDNFGKFFLFVVLSLSSTTWLSSCLIESKTSFMDNRDLIEEFDIDEVVEVCLDLAAVLFLIEGR